MKYPRPHTLPSLLMTLPEHFRWTLHNVLGHPLSELLHLVGARRASNWVHDQTIPLYSAAPRG